MFCSLAVLNPRVGHRRFVTFCKIAPYRNSLTYLLTMDILSPFISVLCHICALVKLHDVASTADGS